MLQASRPAGEPIAYQPTDNPRATKSTAAETTMKTTSKPAVEPDKSVKSATTIESSETAHKAPINSADQNEVLNSTQEPQVEKLLKTDQKVHVVVQGETFYSISKKYAVSIKDIETWNQLDDQSVLGIGQQLKISNGTSHVSKEGAIAPEVPKTRTMIHKVRSGETLYQIARDYDASIKQLMEWNEKSDFNLRIGEELKIVTTL